MQWITRERPKIDRIACPWLVARFIDPQAEFLYVPAADVLRMAQETGAVPYDIPDVELSPMSASCAASTPSWPSIDWMIRPSNNWPRSCVGLIPPGSISRHNRPGCMPSRSGCRRPLPTTMKCSNTAC